MSVRVKRKPAKYAEDDEPVSKTTAAVTPVAQPLIEQPPQPPPKSQAQPKPQSQSKQSAKRKNAVHEEEVAGGGKRQYRSCEKARCPARIPICFANASERCAGDSYTSRWYHMSAGEHFCNECFDYYYRSHRDGYKLLAAWKKDWSRNGKTEPNLKSYMADQVVPYWVQCIQPNCRKWRSLPNTTNLTPEMIKDYRCGSESPNTNVGNPCDWPQDPRVDQVLDSLWLQLLNTPPLLKNSPAACYLSSFFPDGVGLSPTSKTDFKETDTNPYFQPFYQPDEQGKALCLSADMMEYDEVQAFPEFSKEQQMYLAARNLVLALWAGNPKEFLTPEKCSPHLIVRGLVRISCFDLLHSVLVFLTKKGLINTGLLQNPPPEVLPILPDDKQTIIIVGAGAAGLAAGRHLTNFGYNTIILEARDRIGGRVWDDEESKVCIGRGAHIVNGCINNPFTLMCEQGGFKTHKLHHRCDLMEEGGTLVEPTSDKRVDFHFNAMLDAVSEWRKDKRQSDDVSLGKKIKEMHQTFLDETGLTFSVQEDRLLQFHISNLEYACGCHLSKVSSLHWDQNEVFPQFAGDHVLLCNGYGAILSELQKGQDVRLNQEVERIDYSQDSVTVKTKQGMEMTCTKVLVTVPLALLQEGALQFNPKLPDDKVKALSGLGAGQMEKVILEFSSRFWSSRVDGTDYFGRLPVSDDKRGFYAVFYDMTRNMEDRKTFILMTVVSGEAVNDLKKMEDKDVIDQIINCLRDLFPSEDVPEPVNYHVTRWYKDRLSKMSYSYIKTGGSGELYDVLAEDVGGKIFFAGEATNRHFPQTVTGAYLSGIREASKITEKLQQMM